MLKYWSYIIAGNKNTPESVLQRLAEGGDPRVRKRLAENPRTPQTVLELMAHDEDREVRLAVACNGNISDGVLAEMARDQDLDFRLSVAETVRSPLKILEILADDENPYIASQAQKTLEIKRADDAFSSAARNLRFMT